MESFCARVKVRGLVKNLKTKIKTSGEWGGLWFLLSVWATHWLLVASNGELHSNTSSSRYITTAL